MQRLDSRQSMKVDWCQFNEDGSGPGIKIMIHIYSGSITRTQYIPAKLCTCSGVQRPLNNIPRSLTIPAILSVRYRRYRWQWDTLIDCSHQINTHLRQRCLLALLRSFSAAYCGESLCPGRLPSWQHHRVVNLKRGAYFLHLVSLDRGVTVAGNLTSRVCRT